MTIVEVVRQFCPMRLCLYKGINLIWMFLNCDGTGKTKNKKHWSTFVFLETSSGSFFLISSWNANSLNARQWTVRKNKICERICDFIMNICIFDFQLWFCEFCDIFDLFYLFLLPRIVSDEPVRVKHVRLETMFFLLHTMCLFEFTFFSEYISVY